MRHFTFYEAHITTIIAHLIDDAMSATKVEPLLVHALHSLAEAITWIGECAMFESRSSFILFCFRF